MLPKNFCLASRLTGQVKVVLLIPKILTGVRTMNRKTAIPLILAALAIFGWGLTFPALAYYPPLQNVTGPTVVQTTDTKVNVSVHDPATGQDIPGVWSIAGGAGATAIDQIVKNQGMVAWRVHDLVNNKYMVVAGVYDPNPQQGWQFFSGWMGWLDNAPNILALNDGVLLYECQYTTGTEPNQQWHTEEYFATYDPASEMPDQHWIVGWRVMSYSWTSYTPGSAYSHVVKDGAATFVYYSPTFDYELCYLIYDSRIHAWVSNPGGWSDADFVNLSINTATVYYHSSGFDKKAGYDYTDMTWKDGQDTKTMANFTFAPFEPLVNRFVYFTDMSIAATSWTYDIFAEGFSTAQRSFSYKFPRVGIYVVSQQVIGPTGIEPMFQAVPVKAPANPGLALLLLEG
jgi:hypothetical protein